MASVTESLFGSLFQTPGQSQAQAIQEAYQPVSDAKGMLLGQIRGTGAELQANIGKAFGQEPVADQQKRKLQAIVQATQQQVDVGTPEGLAKLAENLNQLPEFTGIALALRQQAAKQAQETQVKQSQIFKNIAQGEKAGQEKLAKIGVSSDGKAVYRLGMDEFTLENGKPVRFSGSLRKEAGDITVGGEDIFKAINQVNSATNNLDKQISSLDNAISLLNKSDSPFAQAAFTNEVASVFGDANKAQAEIKAIANTGNLGQRVENTIDKFLRGRIGEATKEDQRETLVALRKEIGKRFNNVTKGFRGAAENDPRYKNAASQIAPTFEEKYGNPPESKEIISVPPSVVSEKGWKDGQRVKRKNKEYTFSAAKNQLIED